MLVYPLLCEPLLLSFFGMCIHPWHPVPNIFIHSVIPFIHFLGQLQFQQVQYKTTYYLCRENQILFVKVWKLNQVVGAVWDPADHDHEVIYCPPWGTINSSPWPWLSGMYSALWDVFSSLDKNRCWSSLQFFVSCCLVGVLVWLGYVRCCDSPACWDSVHNKLSSLLRQISQ